MSSSLASDEGGTSQQEQRKGKEAPIDANPLAESHDKEMSQQGKPKELRRLRELIKKPCSGPVRSASVVSIFRVPNCLKGSKTTERDSYVPNRVSLGPYHHTTAELSPMDRHKGKALRRMDPHKGKALCRMKTRFNNSAAKEIEFGCSAVKEIEFRHSAVKEIKLLEKAIRDSYEEIIEYDGETLALMLSLDGSFVLEILRTLKGELDEPHQACKYYEPIFEVDKIENTGLDILNDILKLENQIPWIVLQKLLQLELKSTEDYAREKLQQLIVEDRMLSMICPFDLKKYRLSEQSSEEAPDHLLGFLHSFIVSPPRDQYQKVLCIKCCYPGCITVHREKVPEEKDQSKMGEEDDKDILQISCYIKCCSTGCIMRHKNIKKGMNDLPRAVELSNAGIKFKSCTSIREIKFDRVRATIYLPWISISDHTEVLFRNLIAFEMCKLRSCETNYVADYVYLMDRLIDSEKDVSLLRRMGIVENMLGSDKEVAELFNGLSKGVTVGHVFEGLMPKVIQEIQHYRNKWKVQFKENYLSSPWKAFALVGAIIGLLSSLAQTIILIITLQK